MRLKWIFYLQNIAKHYIKTKWHYTRSLKNNESNILEAYVLFDKANKRLNFLRETFKIIFKTFFCCCVLKPLQALTCFAFVFWKTSFA